MPAIAEIESAEMNVSANAVLFIRAPINNISNFPKYFGVLGYFYAVRFKILHSSAV